MYPPHWSAKNGKGESRGEQEIIIKRGDWKNMVLIYDLKFTPLKGVCCEIRTSFRKFLFSQPQHNYPTSELVSPIFCPIVQAIPSYLSMNNI